MAQETLRVVFALPNVARTPVGGFKVVYEYANRLALRGHHVTVTHLVVFRPRASLLNRMAVLTKYLFRKSQGRSAIAPWFSVLSQVNLLLTRQLNTGLFADADAVIATSWETAELLNAWSGAKPPLFYLIQHLEIWSDEARAMATWRAPLHKIVIANWLREIADSLQEKSFYLPNGLDFERFYLTASIEDRVSPCVMMLYHAAADKGSADGLAALTEVRKQVAGVRAILFGVPPRPSALPGWIEYYQQPEQGLLRSLYNQAQVFVTPSWTEGWGLPASEAMMCGAALAATDVGGHREFAVHERTALLSQPRHPADLAHNIVLLLSDPDLRIRIAKQGNAEIQRFTWERSVNALEEYLSRVVRKTT